MAARMGYGNKVYQKALNELNKRRLMAEDKADGKKRDFFARCPRAEEITRKKTTAAARIARAVLQGEQARPLLEKLRDENLQLKAEYDSLLRESGLTDTDVTPQYRCKKCNDTGFVDGRMCTCLNQLQKSLAYESLNLQVPLESSTFDRFSIQFYSGDARTQMERIYSYCRRYAENFTTGSSNLMFRGATGLGKTHLSLAIAGVAIDNGYGVIYSSTQNLAVALEKERFDKVGGDRPEDTNSQLISCDLLILDDLGTEFSSSYTAAALYNIINTRLLAQKPTIISTNLSFKELETRYSERFASRIFGSYNILEFIGADIRIEKRKNNNR